MGVDPIAEEFMSISTYQVAHNNPVWKIELEGLEGKETQGKDLINHESIKVVNRNNESRNVPGLGIEAKLVQESTKEVIQEGTKQVAKSLLKGLATVGALLTDYMSPNFRKEC